jgi:hypothetical protein
MPTSKPKPKKPGRPKLSKSESKGKIVPVRFEPEDFALATSAAKAAKQTISAWIRHAIRATAETQMFDGTLHKAMQIVLLERESETATTGEIAKEIEQRQLYKRKDGDAARAAQINARVRHYPELFRFVEAGTVGLVSNDNSTSKG